MRESTDKRYYKIREVAELLQLPASTLRFWESQFTILKPKRNDGGTRFYTPSDIETLKMIKYLVKDKGLKIEAAQEAVRREKADMRFGRRSVDGIIADLFRRNMISIIARNLCTGKSCG